MSDQLKVPSYRRHKQSGQAIVTLTDGLGGRKDVLLGKYGSRESRSEYARVIAEWEAGGRTFRGCGRTSGDLTVNELILHFWNQGPKSEPEISLLVCWGSVQAAVMLLGVSGGLTRVADATVSRVSQAIRTPGPVTRTRNGEGQIRRPGRFV
jgi:hypothetical protein